MKNKKIAVLIFSIFIFGCNSPPESELLNNYELSSNYDGLIDLYKNKLELEPDNVDLKLSLINTYIKSGDFESAEFHLNNLDVLKVKDNYYYFYLKGKVDSYNRRHQAAMFNYEKSEDLGNNSSSLFIDKGISLSNINQYEQALYNFNKARLLGYQDKIIKNNISYVYIKQGKYQKAIDLLKPLYKKHPNDIKISSNLELAILLLEQDTDLDVKPSLIINKGGESDRQKLKLKATNKQCLKNKSKLYFVQVGAYKSKDLAEKRKKEMHDYGYRSNIYCFNYSNGELLYRVMINNSDRKKVSFNSEELAKIFIRKNKSYLDDYFIQYM